MFEICLHHFPNEIRVNMIFSKINFRNVYLLVQGIWVYNPIRCYGDFRHTSLDDDVRISFKMWLAWFALLVAYFFKNSVAQVLKIVILSRILICNLCYFHIFPRAFYFHFRTSTTKDCIREIKRKCFVRWYEINYYFIILQ